MSPFFAIMKTAKQISLLVATEKQQAWVMVGAPGAGKSTYAAKLAKKENAVIISGDNIRKELWGDAAFQGDWNSIRARMEELLTENLGRNIIIDGTHVMKAYREETIALLRSYGYMQIEAVVIDASLDKCIMQNAARQRNVPRYVIVDMWEKLQSSLKNLSDEDFSSIRFISEVYEPSC